MWSEKKILGFFSVLAWALESIYENQAYKIVSVRHHFNNQFHNMGIWLFLSLLLIIVSKSKGNSGGYTTYDILT